MPSKKSTKKKINPIVAPPTAAPVTAVPVMATPAPPTAAAKEDPFPVLKNEPTPVVPQAVVAKDDEAHFDVAQSAYGTAKDIWSWGKSVPVVSNLLGIAEAVVAKVLDTTVHMDLPALDSQVAAPQLKKLDDDIVTPVILAVWKLIEPALVKSDEMVLRPVLKEVVPRVLAPWRMFDEKKTKKDLESKKAEERKAMIDISPNPEVVPALN